MSMSPSILLLDGNGVHHHSKIGRQVHVLEVEWTSEILNLLRTGQFRQLSKSRTFGKTYDSLVPRRIEVGPVNSLKVSSDTGCAAVEVVSTGKGQPNVTLVVLRSELLYILFLEV